LQSGNANDMQSAGGASYLERKSLLLSKNPPITAAPESPPRSIGCEDTKQLRDCLDCRRESPWGVPHTTHHATPQTFLRCSVCTSSRSPFPSPVCRLERHWAWALAPTVPLAVWNQQDLHDWDKRRGGVLKKNPKTCL